MGDISLDTKEFDKLMNDKNSQYLNYISGMNTSDLLPDVDRVLRFNRKRPNHILGSASKNARPILDKLNITPLFDAIVDGNDVTKAKPNPEVFLKAASSQNHNQEIALFLKIQ